MLLASTIVGLIPLAGQLVSLACGGFVALAVALLAEEVRIQSQSVSRAAAGQPQLSPGVAGLSRFPVASET